MKKLTSILITLAMLMTFVPYASALEIVASGECGAQGDNVIWTLNSDGVLTISGEGEMADFGGPNDLPYGSVVGNVTSIVIEDGITYIGNNAFCWAIANMKGEVNVKTVTIPKTVKGLGICTFAYVENVDTVYYNAEDCKFAGDSLGFAYNYFPRGKNLVIGKDVKNIGANVFYRATGFDTTQNTYTSVKYEGSQEAWGNVTVDYTGNDVLKYIAFEDNSVKEKPIRILLNNKFLQADQDPVLINDRTMVPLRAIFEALGATVDWNDVEESITARKDEKNVYMQIGNNVITVDGSTVTLDVPAQIVNNRTMVPVRAVAEAFDCIVSWNGYQQYVIITPKGQRSYKIEAVDGNGEIVATAHFNDKGQLTNIENDTTWFMPLIAHINGNCYMDLFWKCPNNIAIQYDGNNISEISVSDRWDYSYTYVYNSDNCIESSSYHGSQGSEPAFERVYNSDKIIYPKYINSDLMISFTLNEWGLTSSYDMSESGGSGSLMYDDNGNLTHWTTYFGIDYSYNAQNRLSQATRKENIAPMGNTITYRYIDE